MTTVAGTPARLDRRERMALVAAAIIVAYAAIVAVLPLTLRHSDPMPPWWFYRPMVLFGLLAVPGLIAAIGVVRHVRRVVVAAGVQCLLQSLISAVAFPFLVPAAVLLVVGSTAGGDHRLAIRTALLGGIGIVALGLAAWVSLFALTKPRCWEGTRAADGTLTIIEVPATDSELHGPALVPSGGAGCSSAEITIQGIGVSTAAALAAIGLAAKAPRT